MQAICDSLTEDKIEALARKWLKILPNPLTAEDQAAGYAYDLSVLRAEFPLTQVLDTPVAGRIFSEQVLRDNSGIPGGHRARLPRRPGSATRATSPAGSSAATASRQAATSVPSGRSRIGRPGQRLGETGQAVPWSEAGARRPFSPHRSTPGSAG